MLKLMYKEFLVLIHKRTLVFIVLIFAASLYALLVGNLYQAHTVQNIPVIVCDLDQSTASRQFIEAISTADQYDFKGIFVNEAEAQQCLYEKKAQILITIPPKFYQKLLTGEPQTINYVADGTNALHNSYAETSIQGIIASIAAEYQVRSAASGGVPLLPPNPINLSVRITQNSTQSYSLFYLYGIMLTAAQIGVMISFGLSLHNDKRKGFSTHNNVLYTLLTKEAFYYFFSLLSIVISSVLIMTIFQLPFQIPIFKTYLLLSAFIFTVLNLSGIFVVYFKTELALVQALVFYTLPAFLLSGYIWPEQGMPPLIKGISYFIPLHYILIDFRSLVLSGTAPTLWTNVTVLFITGLVLFTINYIYIKVYSLIKD